MAAAHGNYLKLTEEITELNACTVAKKILFGLDPILRAQDLNMYCTQEFIDMYNESYQSLHGALPYNLGYEKNTMEGSNNKLHMIPLTNKRGSKFSKFGAAKPSASISLLRAICSWASTRKTKIGRPMLAFQRHPPDV